MGAVAALLAAAGYAAGSARRAPAGPEARQGAYTLGGCATDTECEWAEDAAHAAVAEAREFEADEARARRAFETACYAGRVPCIDRRPAAAR